MASSAAIGQEAPKPLIDEPEPRISISTPKEVSPNNSGLVAAGTVDLPDTLWKDLSDSELERLLKAVDDGVVSAAIRGLALRALTASVEAPESGQDLLAERAEALLALGQPALAGKLLALVPQGYRTERQEQQAFLLGMLGGVEADDACQAAAARLTKKPDPFWQRWLILCQAKAGENDKAQLGLDLLTEQNEFSEFFQKLVQSMLSGQPLTKLPEVLFLEQAVWLHFAGNQDYLEKQAEPPLALLGMIPADQLPEAWQTRAARYGVGGFELKAPPQQRWQPPLSGLQSKNLRVAFLSYGLRKALDLPVSIETEQRLQSQAYRAKTIVLSPAWREAVQNAGAQGQSGRLALLLATTLTGDLNACAPADIVLAVAALMKADLTADAAALAREALEAARKDA